MTGRPAFERDSYLDDIKNLRGRGYNASQIATELGMHRATVYRILKEAKGRR